MATLLKDHIETELTRELTVPPHLFCISPHPMFFPPYPIAVPPHPILIPPGIERIPPPPAFKVHFAKRELDPEPLFLVVSSFVVR